MHNDNTDDLPALPPLPEPGAVIVPREEWQALLDRSRERQAFLERVLSEVKAAREMARQEQQAHADQVTALTAQLRAVEGIARRNAAALTTALNALTKLYDVFREVMSGMAEEDWSESERIAASQARELLALAGREVK